MKFLILLAKLSRCSFTVVKLCEGKMHTSKVTQSNQVGEYARTIELHYNIDNALIDKNLIYFGFGDYYSQP